MTAFFVTKEGEELTHELMTQRLMQRLTEVEATNKDLYDCLNNLTERLHYLENQI